MKQVKNQSAHRKILLKQIGNISEKHGMKRIQ